MCDDGSIAQLDGRGPPARGQYIQALIVFIASIEILNVLGDTTSHRSDVASRLTGRGLQRAETAGWKQFVVVVTSALD